MAEISILDEPMDTTNSADITPELATSVDNKTIDNIIPFSDLCSLFDKINETAGKENKKKIYNVFLRNWRRLHDQLYKDIESGKVDNFYPILRLCLPHLDQKRTAYGMKETVLAKIYIDVLSLAKEGDDAQKLLNYKAPRVGKGLGATGDFAGTAYKVLENRCPAKGCLTISEINQCLDSISKSNASHDRTAIKKTLQQLLRTTTAIEQKWLIRIIVKELKIGISENTILTLFHLDAVDLFSVCADLEKVCIDLVDPKFRLNEAEIQLFTPFRPMLGQRASIPQILKLSEGKPVYVETKFDGDRIQIHKQGDNYQYFSRSSKDYSTTFGTTSIEGCFTAQIHGTFKPEIQSCILDGEMVGFNSEDGCIIPKGDNIDVKALGYGINTQLPYATNKYANIQQCFVVFDVLMINGKNFANSPLTERSEQLKTVFTPKEGWIHLVDRKELQFRDDLVTALNEAIDNREEGLLVKIPSSTYQPDKRKGSGWLKIKPEYLDSLSDKLDLIILGGYYGTGRRGGMISHFLLGVAESAPPGMNPSQFYSFCKVGTGYSISELRELGEELKSHWRKFTPHYLPDSINLTSGNKEKPDVIIDPQHSKIVQIRAAEITSSDKYSCDCTLRFPRLEKFRDDKEWYQCMTLDELDNIKEVSSGRLAHSNVDGFEDLPVKRRKIGNVGRKFTGPQGVASHFRGANISDLEVTSDTFAGKQICVINGVPEMTKNEIERKIAEYGGTFVQNPTDNTFCVLVGKTNMRTSSIIKSSLYDVVEFNWFSECIKEERFIPLMPRHMIFAKSTTQKDFNFFFDEYGDSYTDTIKPSEFRDLCMRIKKNISKEINLSHLEIAEIKDKYIDDLNTAGIFRHYTFYIDRYLELNNTSLPITLSPLEITELYIKYHGGAISLNLSHNVTHVVIDTEDTKRVSEIRKHIKSLSALPYIVTEKWVSDSIDDKNLKDEKSYESFK